MNLIIQPSDDDPILVCAERRRRIARLVYSAWTEGGSDLSALAPAFFDGRLDVLSFYTTLADQDDNDNREHNTGYCESPNTSIDTYHWSDLSYADFFHRYMLPNRPVIIQGLAEHWKATSAWTSEDHREKVPNLEYLATLFGESVAPVHVQSSPGFTPSRPVQQDTTVMDYAIWWKHHHRDHGNCDTDDDNRDEVNDDSSIWYLKDWKFVAAHAEYDAYEWPPYFQDDWLNGSMGHAYKFVYLGPKGSCTRLHADVLMSYSWSTNVCGCKRWYLVPPQYSYLLYDCFGESLACHLHLDNVESSGDTSMLFPGLAKVRKYAIEVVQQAGETIFVPSKWYHTVENLAPTLSINHNWLNGTNIHYCWAKVQSEILALQHSERSSDVEPRTESRSSHNNKDTSQIGDDLLSIWLVVSKKAHEIVQQDLSMCQDEQMMQLNLFNLHAILLVLQGIHQLIHEGKQQDLTARCECNVDSLILEVEDAIDKMEYFIK
jgi:hypothetical protein